MAAAAAAAAGERGVAPAGGAGGGRAPPPAPPVPTTIHEYPYEDGEGDDDAFEGEAPDAPEDDRLAAEDKLESLLEKEDADESLQAVREGVFFFIESSSDVVDYLQTFS